MKIDKDFKDAAWAIFLVVMGVLLILFMVWQARHNCTIEDGSVTCVYSRPTPLH